MSPLTKRDLKEIVLCADQQTTFMNPKCASCQKWDKKFKITAKAGKALLKQKEALQEENSILMLQLNDQNTSLQHELDNALARIKHLKHTLAGKDKLLLTYERELREVEQKPSEQSNKTDLLKTERLQGKIAQLEVQKSVLETNNTSLKVQLLHSEEKESSLEQQLRESQDEIAELKKEILLQADKEEKLEENVIFLTDKLASVEMETEQYMVKNEHLQQELNAATEKLKDQNDQLEDMRTVLAEVHAIMKDLQNNKTPNVPDDGGKDSLQTEISNSLDTIIYRMCDDDNSMHRAVSRKLIKLGSLVSHYCENLPGFLKGRDL